MTKRDFPEDFFWGASTAAYQIEGAAFEEGRGQSIWDSFTEAGRIADGSNAYQACDHYHRFPEDVALLKNAGFKRYRFSIAWPRILPQGRGTINQKGIDFYSRLVDCLLEADIQPMACLYHWDLPQLLQDEGGWQNRSIVKPFIDYAQIMTKSLADRVKDWVMLNEPNVVAIFGYGVGDHAPGLKLGEQGILRALHHQNLAQGLALKAISAEHKGLSLGTVCNIQPCYAQSERPEDKRAAELWDAVWNRVILDGLLLGEIPSLLQDKMADFVASDDLTQIKHPIDRLGINYYSKMTMKYEEGHPFNVWWGEVQCDRWTFMGWPIQPDGLYHQLIEFRDRYGNIPVYIAENGAAFDDKIEKNGKILDRDRVNFYHDHLQNVAKALAEGCAVKGYLCWSLLDNFEWAFGLSKRFGIVHVDYETLKRTPKESYFYLSQVAKTGLIDPP